MTVRRELLARGLGLTLETADLPGLGTPQRGKVREGYRLTDGTRLLVTTDRVSAFDRVLGTLPFKGQVLNGLSAWWFRQTASLVPNHLIDVPDPQAMRVIDCTPLPVEFVVRAYLTGVTSTSIWTHYARGEREFCGHRLPDGLRKNEPLPRPILTPSTKASHGAHDVSVSRERLLAAGAVTSDELDQVEPMVLALFEQGRRVCAERGLLLVDTKYEIGRTTDGRLVVIDEVHTPDSSRFWRASTYEDRLRAGLEPESLDKEWLRRWLVERGYRGEGEPPRLNDEVRIEAAGRYVEVFEALTGRPFEPDLEPPLERLRRNVASLVGSDRAGPVA
ncbi:MAG: phosphoribosylaminoimidazolesuccinocarboxamide synthase [Myxococcota bacterium]|nr:phosphoribosylaminoimidazolesuccinocarboxamide synthase [Myxococcota bacterium]MDW8361014.1 phosphoribosylaminoimidazolesuccinocarboxamide synthase [Myxococcales bacterium]